MWTAFSLALLTAGGIAIYAAWAFTLAARGAPVWLLVLGAPLLYCAIVLVIMAVYFATAWFYRAERPPQSKIGFPATVRLLLNEYRALLGSLGRMVFYNFLVRDPAPVASAAPVLL